MLNVPASVRIYLHTAPADMCKGIDGLSGMVRGEFGSDPLDGSLLLFTNCRRDRLKNFIGTAPGSGFFKSCWSAARSRSLHLISSGLRSAPRSWPCSWAVSRWWM